MTGHPNSFAARTHCIHGHDLRLPGAVARQSNGYSRCRECRNKVARESRHKKPFTRCRQCRCAYERPTTWAFCSKVCERENRRLALARAAAERADLRRESDHANADRLLELALARERAATHWEREAISKQIADLVPA